MRTRSLLPMIVALAAGVAAVHAAVLNPVASPRTDVQFSQSAPYVSLPGLRKHLGYPGPLPAYHVSNEVFQVIVPTSYSTNQTWGLLVWVSAADEPRVPRDWDAELSVHRLLVVSAHHGGNERDTVDRFRLALDATCNICRRYTIDPKRIYVGGFSGGARIASMLGVAYADLFCGTLCVCGVDFYQPIPAAGGGYYLANYMPDPGVLLLAKKRRYVLLTGQNDINRDNTRSTSDNGFKRAGFKNVLYLEVPGMSHALPARPTLKTALDYLVSE